jgi:hypothetical protein
MWPDEPIDWVLHMSQWNLDMHDILGDIDILLLPLLHCSKIFGGCSCSCLGRVGTIIGHNIMMVMMWILHDTKDWCTHLHKIIHCLMIHRSKR